MQKLRPGVILYGLLVVAIPVAAATIMTEHAAVAFLLPYSICMGVGLAFEPWMGRP